MLEQDVQLTRLIVEKLTDLDQRKQQVSWQLTEAQERLDKIESLRTQRSAYENVLERAAALLGRDDLRVEIDVPVDDAQLAEDLKAELSVLDAEQGQYLELVDELRQRAPDLLEAAAGMAPESLQALFAPLPEERLEAADEAEGMAAAETALEDAVADDEPELSDEALDEDELEEAEVELETLAASEPEAEWTPPAFRPPYAVAEDDEAEEEAFVSMADEDEAVGELAASSELRSEQFDAATEPASSNGVYAASAAELSESLLSESAVNWPQLSEALDAETEPEIASPSYSFASSALDDSDEVEVISRINYDELASESSAGGTHYSNGHYSNGSHAHETVAEVEQSDETLAETHGEANEADTDEVADSYANGHHAYGAAESHPDGGLSADPEWSVAEEEANLGLASGAAGYVVEVEQSQSFAAAVAGLDHSSDFSADFAPAPAFASESADYGMSGEATAVAVEVMAASETETAEPAEAVKEEDARERLIRLSRFNHAQLNKRVDGAAPVFVIDATAVLERIPHYDRYHLALDEAAARDELVRDFSFLGAELDTTVHLVFNDPHNAGFELNQHVMLEHGDIESGDPNPGDQRIQEIVLDYIERDQPVALVTSDPTLQGLFKGENVVVFSLGEFFLT